MEDLKRMAIFAQVVEAQSFSEAARMIGIAKSAVSKHVSLLEKELGVQLLYRTTRKLSLTEVGEIYYQSCAKIICEASEARARLSQLRNEPLGSLRISCTVAFGEDHLIPALHLFLQRYSQLQVEIQMSDQVTNIVEEGIDVAIRIGWLPDSSFIARKLVTVPLIVCASPSYIKKHGMPETPTDLIKHKWIILTRLPSPRRWVFTKNEQQQTIQVKGRIKVNSVNGARAFALAGEGISVLSHYLVYEDIKKGRLIPLLNDYRIQDIGIYAIYQHPYGGLAKIKLLVDFLVAYFKAVEWGKKE